MCTFSGPDYNVASFSHLGLSSYLLIVLKCHSGMYDSLTNILLDEQIKTKPSFLGVFGIHHY